MEGEQRPAKTQCQGCLFSYKTTDAFSFFSLSQVAGHSAVDEFIMEYTGESPFKTYMERKPHPWGFKIFFWCFSMGNTGRPVLYVLIPDLRLSIHSTSEIRTNYTP